MLYDRWREIARDCRTELALHDLACGSRWTFGELAAAAEKASSDTGPVSLPQGSTAAFVIEILRAWREHRPVCPLDTGQEPPALRALPAGCIHLKLTSATSSTAKVIAFTAEQLAADVENIVATMGLRQDWPNLGVISLAHSYGFSNLILPLLLRGIPLVLLDSPLPEAVRQALGGLESVTLPAVPALWRTWHEAGVIAPNIRLAISAGAPLPLALEHDVFKKAGTKIHNFYGASECGGIAYDTSSTPRTDAACVGMAMRNISLSIDNEGCLEVRSRAVGTTYWPEPRPSLRDGCYRTEDLAELRDGAVLLRGRVGDLINVAGRKVAPETIERALLTHAGIKECLVFGVPSTETERSEMIVACVVAVGGASGAELKQFLLERLPAWQVPREWRFVDSLEANRRGKLSRAEWRTRYVTGA